MVKTLKNLLFRNQNAYDLETWYVALSARVLPNLSNDDPGLTLTYYDPCAFVWEKGKTMTLTYFTARSNLVHYAFVWEKVKTIDFSETCGL